MDLILIPVYPFVRKIILWFHLFKWYFELVLPFCGEHGVTISSSANLSLGSSVSAVSLLYLLSGYHADTPITIKAEAIP